MFPRNFLKVSVQIIYGKLLKKRQFKFSLKLSNIYLSNFVSFLPYPTTMCFNYFEQQIILPWSQGLNTSKNLKIPRNALN